MAPSLTSRPNQNCAPGVSARIVSRKPMITSTSCQPELPFGFRMPRCCHQLQDAPFTRQAETVGQPIGQAGLCGGHQVRLEGRQACWLPAWQVLLCAATVSRPFQQRCCCTGRRPDSDRVDIEQDDQDRADRDRDLGNVPLVPSGHAVHMVVYQLSIEVRNLVMSLAALVASDCSDVVNGKSLGSRSRPS